MRIGVKTEVGRYTLASVGVYIPGGLANGFTGTYLAKLSGGFMLAILFLGALSTRSLLSP